MRPAPGLACLFSSLVLAAQSGAPLTVDSIYHPSRKVSYVETPATRWSWRPDGSLLEERMQQDKVAERRRLDPLTWTSQPLFDAERAASALAAAGVDPAEARNALGGSLQWNPAQDAFLVTVASELYLVEIQPAKARRLTEPGPKDSPAFSPDGTRVAYLRGHDMYVAETATGKETRLTTGGDDNHSNGRLDWVYQEEVYTRDNFRAFWWAPDSRRLAYLSLDETRVPAFTLMDDRTQPQRAVTFRYPKAGDPNPVARLGVVDLEGATSWMEDPFPGQETLIVRVGWDPKGRLVASYQNRVQSWLDCRRFEQGKGRSLVREESSAWVEHLQLPHFLSDGSFLWNSARSGFHHLYHFDTEGGLKGAITGGDWDVRNLLGVDEKAGQVYFEGTRRNPIGLDAYRADLGGGPNHHLRLLTEQPGTHSVTFNASFTAALDRWSDVQTPGEQRLIDKEGRILQRITPRTTDAFKALKLGKVSFQTVPTRDGFPMETMLVLPPDFNPARKYPVVQEIYGGPATPTVRNAYSRNALWYQFLAQQGYVTWICDNRSASNKGARSAHGIHRNLGAQELQDQLDGLAWLKSQGFADMDRVALSGYSYGGFMTAFALTHSPAWKLGVVGAPVVDWHLYDSIYTERYMGLPKDNPEGYEASSALKAAAKLSGKVMFIQGTLDDNVHPQNTVQFIDALQKAGHETPLTLLPGSTHSPRAPQHTWAMHQAIWSFLKGNL